MKKINNLDEKLLKFKSAHFGFLSTFFLNIGNTSTREEVIKKLEEKNINADWKKPYSEQFKIAEDFLLPQDLCRKRFRIKLENFTISFKSPLKNIVLGESTKVEVFLTIYKELNVGILMFNIILENCSTDDLIYVRQCFDGRFRLKTDLPPFIKLKKSNNFLLIKETIDLYINSINKVFNSEIKTKLYTNLLEIDTLTNYNTNNPEEVVINFPKQIYGLLTGDEGWRFVPKQRAVGISLKKWSTRDFHLILSFHYSILLLHFTYSNRYKNYIKACKDIRKLYERQVEKYFTFSSEIAGLDHGPLLILENASVERFLLNEILAPESSIKKMRISSFLIERDRIINTLNILSFLQIREISDMAHMIKEDMQIFKDIERIEEKLKLYEGEIIIKYNQRINHLIVILTIVGLIVAALSLMNL